MTAHDDESDEANHHQKQSKPIILDDLPIDLNQRKDRAKGKIDNEKEDEAKDDWPKDIEHASLAVETSGIGSSNSPSSPFVDRFIATSERLIDAIDEDNGVYKYPNRMIRPGMIKLGKGENKISAGHRRAQTTPNIPSFIDDFDFCKYDHGGSLIRKKNDSPLGRFENDMALDVSTKRNYLKWTFSNDRLPSYGAIDLDDEEENGTLQYLKSNGPKGSDNEIYNRKLLILDSAIDSVFSSLRSMSTADFQAEIDACDNYASWPIWKRAFSVRFLPLLTTFAIEIPVSLMILASDKKLCSVVGFSRYKILMAVMPMTMALSGNCGLQSSILSTRGISHLHVMRNNYGTWLLHELQVAAVLGLTMGISVGAIAYQLSGFDGFFGLAVCASNVLAMLSSGLTGTLAPLLFTFFFHQDEEKWTSLLATALQDIIGCVSMVYCVKGCYWMFSEHNADHNSPDSPLCTI